MAYGAMTALSIGLPIITPPRTSHNYTTTVTDPAGNQTVIVFSGGFEVNRSTYQGSSGQGTWLQTVATCYNGCGSHFGRPITEVRTTLQLANGQQNKRVTFFDINTGQVTELDEYDFGNNQPGPLLRKTVTSYAPLTNGISAPQSITVCIPGGSDTACNGSGTTGGTIVAQTSIGYDETAPTPATGVTQHVCTSEPTAAVSPQHTLMMP
jgi:hypothetical protein